MISIRRGRPAEIPHAEIARERQPKPAEEVLEREIEGKTFKLGKSLGQAAQDQIADDGIPMSSSLILMMMVAEA